MQREIAVLRTLAGSGGPHPEIFAACEDLDVLGVVFYLMEDVDGFNPLTEVAPAYRDPEVRHRVGLKTLPKTANMKAAVTLLRNGGFLGILSDQSAGRTEGLPVPFMGHPAYTFAGAASLAILTGCPVVPVFSFREAPFRHRVEIHPPLPLPDSGDRREKILELTRLCNQAIEDAIRTCPGQWLWLHRRWGRHLHPA